MRILSLRAKDYRTLEDISLEFGSVYTAICGPNDSGKTSIIRALRTFVHEAAASFQVIGDDEEEVSVRQDYPKWKSTPLSERRVELELRLSLDSDKDAGFFQFVTKQLSLEPSAGEIELSVKESYASDRAKGQPDVVVQVDGKVFDGIAAQEVLKRLQNSRAVLFHNSTQVVVGFPFQSSAGALVQAETAGHSGVLDGMKRTVDRGLSKVAKTHKKELEGLLGRLKTKYDVGLSMPTFDFSLVPLRITLGQKQLQVPLDDWGSGTRNRTLILMALFRAKQMSEMAASAEKITPVIVVEEPECFLHPSAQAEFGRILHDLADEFDVQVIVTTHSPYLLNLQDPNANLLLCRSERKKQLQETRQADTSGDRWMDPFAAALGLNSSEFQPWRELLTSPSDSVLLVEGETDKEYLELLRDPAHGSNALRFDGSIIPYEGVGNLHNPILLRFVKHRYRKLFLTFDLDALSQNPLEKTLKSLGFERKKHYEALGLDQPGKRSMEGLLPQSVTQKVYADNHELVQAMMSGEKSERESAKSRLKRLLLERFKADAQPGAAHYAEFYKVARTINHALR